MLQSDIVILQDVIEGGDGLACGIVGVGSGGGVQAVAVGVHVCVLVVGSLEVDYVGSVAAVVAVASGGLAIGEGSGEAVCAGAGLILLV